jgi:hypothetical protein
VPIGFHDFFGGYAELQEQGALVLRVPHDHRTISDALRDETVIPSITSLAAIFRP